MAAIINTNIASLNLQRSLSASQNQLNKAMERLSSGLRINRASDDAAGLAISTTLDASIRGMSVATRNTSDAISFLNVQESSIGNQVEALQRMRELAVQSANGAISNTDRGNLNKEYTELFNETTRIGSSSFNGVAVFGSAGSGSDATSYQIGSGAADIVSITKSDIASAALASVGSVSMATDATAAITAIDTKLTAANSTRSFIGAVSSRFSSILTGLSSSIENTTAAKSRVMDADYAMETSALTRGQILQQAGTAMLTQANSMPNIVLSLLKG